MTRRFLLLVLLVLAPQIALAQRDPPLLECYLPSIKVTHAEDNRLLFDLILKKETGPVEHTEHQMYLLMYLLEDEAEVLRIASTPELLDKSNGDDEKLFLDVLLDRGLVVVSETKLARRQGFAGQDNRGEYSDGSKVGRKEEAFLRLNTFTFSFSPTNAALFESVSQLKHFRNEEAPPKPGGMSKQRFKMLVYVPVNDCKYATEVRDGVRGENDFGLDEYGVGKTPILYCRPLPYEFAFRPDSDVGMQINIR